MDLSGEDSMADSVNGVGTKKRVRMDMRPKNWKADRQTRRDVSQRQAQMWFVRELVFIISILAACLRVSIALTLAGWMKRQHGEKEAGGQWAKGISCAFWCMYLQGVRKGLEEESFLLPSRGKGVDLIHSFNPSSLSTYSLFILSITRYVICATPSFIFVTGRSVVEAFPTGRSSTGHHV